MSRSIAEVMAKMRGRDGRTAGKAVRTDGMQSNGSMGRLSRRCDATSRTTTPPLFRMDASPRLREDPPRNGHGWCCVQTTPRRPTPIARTDGTSDVRSTVRFRRRRRGRCSSCLVPANQVRFGDPDLVPRIQIHSSNGWNPNLEPVRKGGPSGLSLWDPPVQGDPTSRSILPNPPPGVSRRSLCSSEESRPRYRYLFPSRCRFEDPPSSPTCASKFLPEDLDPRCTPVPRPPPSRGGFQERGSVGRLQ